MSIENPRRTQSSAVHSKRELADTAAISAQDSGRPQLKYASALGRALRSRLDLVYGPATAVILMAWVGNSLYHQSLVLEFMTLATIALAMYVPFIMGGVISMAYGAYVAIGAYAVALVDTKTSWPLITGFIAGAIVAGAVALVLALATKRMSGFYLAAITLVFAEAFQVWLTTSAPGGEGGIALAVPVRVFGADLSATDIIWCSLIFAWLLAFLLRSLRCSAFGIAIRARKEVPEAVEACGIRVVSLMAIAQTFGGMVAAFAGGLYTIQNGTITPQAFPVLVVITALFAPLIGGVGSPWGALVGCALVIEFTYNLSFFQSTGSLFYALAIVVVLLIAPRGLLGVSFSRLFRQLSRWRRVRGDAHG